MPWLGQKLQYQNTHEKGHSKKIEWQTSGTLKNRVRPPGHHVVETLGTGYGQVIDRVLPLMYAGDGFRYEVLANRHTPFVLDR